MYLRAFIYFPFVVSLMALGVDFMAGTPGPVGGPNYRSVIGGFMPMAFFGVAILLGHYRSALDKLEARIAALEARR